MTRINLIPESHLQLQARRTHLSRWLLSVSLAACAALAPQAVVWSNRAKAAELQRQIEQVDSESAGVRAALRASSARAAQLVSELDRSRALRTKRSWSGIFALMATATPEDCWLQSLSTDPETPGGGMRANTAAVSAGQPAAPHSVVMDVPRRLRLTGLCTRDGEPLNFVGGLRESKAFSAVSLQKALRTTPDASEAALYQFEIVCEW